MGFKEAGLFKPELPQPGGGSPGPPAPAASPLRRGQLTGSHAATS